MRYGWFAILLSLLLLPTAGAAELKRRSTTSRTHPAPVVNFNTYVLQSIREMPTGGGYAATPEDVARAAEEAVVWSNQEQRLKLSPQKAAPTFCSAAVYMVLLRSLQRWESHAAQRLSPTAWELLDMKSNQPDGTGVWGRVNANGPGLAKLVHDLGAGINFRNIRQAQQGDFLKIFWSDDIGAAERGHLVVYLGLEKKNGAICLKYWSANKPGGYGIKSAPLSRMHNLIFTRIVAPQQFGRAAGLPPHDRWLEAMQQRTFTFSEVQQRCGIR